LSKLHSSSQLRRNLRMAGDEGRKHKTMEGVSSFNARCPWPQYWRSEGCCLTGSPSLAQKHQFGPDFTALAGFSGNDRSSFHLRRLFSFQGNLRFYAVLQNLVWFRGLGIWGSLGTTLRIWLDRLFAQFTFCSIAACLILKISTMREKEKRG
jgi:hypothetical protein